MYSGHCVRSTLMLHALRAWRSQCVLILFMSGLSQLQSAVQVGMA